MITKVSTVAFSGIETIDIEAQIHFAKGQPGLTIVGLSTKAANESRERIRAVLSSIGLFLPPSRITVNLAPADVYKDGSNYDLPIILGILELMNAIPSGYLDRFFALGELSLDGSIYHANGVLPAALHAFKNHKGIICPFANGKEAAWAGEELEIVAAKNIMDLISFFKGGTKIDRPRITESQFVVESSVDISDIEGQNEAKRALEIAACGGHNMLMIGTPGTGKTMLASRINTILPPLDSNEMLEVSMIHSVAGLIKDGVLSSVRPYRAPHHSASMPSIIGGGRNATPGEITIAHRGVLFLDELPEYPRYILDSLRQPLESGQAVVSRANSRVTYPAKFQLIAAMNPCKCGYYGSKTKECSCSQDSIYKYQSRISGPMMDRIDIHIKMQNSRYEFGYDGKLKNEYNMKHESETSTTIRERVLTVRQKQKERYKDYDGVSLNSEVDGELLKKHCMPKDEDSIDALNKIIVQLKVSMRGVSKILRVARTIADMEGSEDVIKRHIIEAALYRPSNVFDK